MGKIVMGGMTVAIGVSVGTAQLGGGQDDSDDDESNDKEKESAGDESGGFGAQMALAFCGAILIAANIAPTEEALVVAAETSPLKLLLIALFSVVLGAYVLFFAEFRGAAQFAPAPGGLDKVRLIVSTYAVALLASASTLFFFGRFDGETWPICLSQTVVVGLAATLGASAGRLLLQSNGANQ